MTDENSWLVASDRGTWASIDAVLAGLVEGRYGPVVKDGTPVPYNTPCLHTGDGSLPPIVISDPARMDARHPDDLVGLAVECLSLPRMGRARLNAQLPLIMAAAALSERASPVDRPVVGAYCATPWSPATVYGCEQIFVTLAPAIVPTDPAMEALLPRLVSASMTPGSRTRPARLMLMPHGRRVRREDLPDAMEILRTLKRHAQDPRRRD